MWLLPRLVEELALTAIEVGLQQRRLNMLMCIQKCRHVAPYKTMYKPKSQSKTLVAVLDEKVCLKSTRKEHPYLQSHFKLLLDATRCSLRRVEFEKKFKAGGTCPQTPLGRSTLL